MKQYHSDVIQYRGNHYDFGYFQGELLKHSPIIRNREIQWGPKKDRHFLINLEDYKKVISRFIPKIFDEIQGLADALHMNMTKAIQLFGGYYLEFTRSGCSILTNTNYMVRNYDSHPRGYEGRYVLYQPTDQGFASIGPSMQITGRIDGLNEKGLAVGYNFTHSKKSEDGFICNMIGRMILETCSNVEDAISLLKDIPHRHSFSYVLLDLSGDSYVVESSPRKIAIRQSYVCTNHFHLLDDENRYRMAETRQREKLIEDKKHQAFNPYDAFKIMNDPTHKIFSNKYDASAGTIHTSTYFPKEKKAWYAIGPNRNPIIFDFFKWVLGQDINIIKIKGVLDHPGPFVNMGKL